MSACVVLNLCVTLSLSPVARAAGYRSVTDLPIFPVFTLSFSRDRSPVGALDGVLRTHHDGNGSARIINYENAISLCFKSRISAMGYLSPPPPTLSTCVPDPKSYSRNQSIESASLHALLLAMAPPSPGCVLSVTRYASSSFQHWTHTHSLTYSHIVHVTVSHVNQCACLPGALAPFNSPHSPLFLPTTPPRRCVVGAAAAAVAVVTAPPACTWNAVEA
ncbi:unnamed protein product [Calypogeia fissa]